jgi:outer membrane protein assembly factor BamB
MRRNGDAFDRIRLVATVVSVAGTAASAAEPWLQWGGPRRDFTVNAPALLDAWPEDGPKVIWQRPLGPGYAQITGDGDGKCLYTLYREGNDDVLVALDATTGKTLWSHRTTTPPLDGQTLDFGTGPNATPLVLEDRIITVSFAGRLNCVARTDGKRLWSHDFVRDFDGRVMKFGHAASPLYYKGKVIALVGGSRYGAVAFDPADGKLVWHSEPMEVSYASPKVINVDGQDQIAFFTSEAVVGIDASDGRKLWSSPVVNRYRNNCTDALWGADNLLWAATQLEGGTRVLEIRRQDRATTVAQKWSNDKVRIFHWNAMRIGNHVYGSLGDRVTLFSATDIRTGEVAWRERGFHKVNSILADGKLIMLDENGKLALAKVSPAKFELISQVDLLEKPAWTPPTLIGSTLYVRDKVNLMALDLAAR